MFLFSLVLASLAGFGLTQLPPRESRTCNLAMTECSDKHLTKGRCRNTWNGFRIDFCKNDRDVNCVSDRIDFRRDQLDYDLNNDNQLCKDEWITHRADYNGFTTEFNAGYHEVRNFPQCFGVSFFDNASFKLQEEFMPNAVAALVTWCQLAETNQQNNRDCWNLPVICKEKKPEYETCKTFDTTILTLKEKLDLNQRTNDANGDGLVTPDEIKADLDNNYDVNNDDCTSRNEWINRWTSFYGFSSEFGAVMYDGAVSANTDKDCLKPEEFQLPVAGVPASGFPESLMKTIIGMCEGNTNLYETNIDCALVADTCITNFPTLAECKIYTDQCGLQQYSTCIDDLITSGAACSSTDDKQEVELEKKRVVVQITDQCLPPGDNASTQQALIWLIAAALTLAISFRCL